MGFLPSPASSGPGAQPVGISSITSQHGQRGAKHEINFSIREGCRQSALAEGRFGFPGVLSMARRLSSSTQLLLIGMIAPVATIAWRIWKGTTQTDYVVFWQAGRSFLSGNPWPIYQSDAIYNFPYPPHALLLFAPFSILPDWPSYLAWCLASALFFAWAARPYSIAALLTPGALVCLHFGQTGLIVGGLWLLAFRGWWPAVAALTFKPHLGFLSALSLRSWRQAAWVALSALLLASPFLALWPDFFHHAVRHTGELTERPRWAFVGVSPGIAYGLLGWIPFAAAAGLMLARNVNVFTAATAALLIAPYGFAYDMPVACFGIYMAAREHWDRLGTLDRIGLALGFLSPNLANLGVWWIPPILLWCLWVQVKLPAFEGLAAGNKSGLNSDGGQFTA